MDFKTLGSSLINSFTEDNFTEYSNRKQLRQTLCSQLDMSSTSLLTRNVIYGSSSSLGRQQIFELCIECVELSDAALKILNGKYRKCLGIKVYWHFMNFEAATPIIQVKESLVKINETQNYTIALNDEFLTYISKSTMKFELYGVFETKEKLIGVSEMDFEDLPYCLEKDIVKRLKIESINKNKFFKRCRSSNNMMGKLTLRYNLSAATFTETYEKVNGTEVKEIYHKLNSAASSEISNDYKKNHNMSKHYMTKFKSLGISFSDYNFIYGILNTILDGERFSSTSEEEYCTQTHKRRINYYRSLEEYAILSGCRIEDIKGNVKVRNYDRLCNYESAIIINIISLNMDERNFPIEKGEVKELYVEYSFLSRSGKDLETHSLPMLENRTIEYNFKRTFLIDDVRNYADCRTLAKMIKQRKSIRFVVIEEPVEETNKFQICKEIGFAEINLFDLIQSEDNVVADQYPIIEMTNPCKRIGYLKISFYGVQAIRNSVLKILTPYVHQF